MNGEVAATVSTRLARTSAARWPVLTEERTTAFGQRDAAGTPALMPGTRVAGRAPLRPANQGAARGGSATDRRAPHFSAFPNLK
jgi:hypothetical protein